MNIIFSKIYTPGRLLFLNLSSDLKNIIIIYSSLGSRRLLHSIRKLCLVWWSKLNIEKYLRAVYLLLQARKVQKAGDMGLILLGAPKKISWKAGICNPAHIGERKTCFAKFWHDRGPVWMLVHKMAEMLFHPVPPNNENDDVCRWYGVRSFNKWC